MEFFKSNIVAFGDSFTLDWDLPDQSGPPEEYGPSKYAWPNILSEKLSYTCVNAALPGFSNRTIWHKILNYSFEPNDVVVILWTWIERYCIITGPNDEDVKPITFSDSTSRRLTTALHINNRFDRMYDSYALIDHANRILKERNITVYNFNVFGLETPPSWASATNMCNISFLNFWKNFPYTSDGTHPGVEAHHEMANVMFNFINNSHM